MRFRKSFSGRPEDRGGDDHSGDLERADQRGGDDEDDGPRLREDQRHVVRTRREEVAVEVVDEGRRKEHREQAPREEPVESEDEEANDRSDCDYGEDEHEVQPGGEYLEGEMGARVDEGNREMGPDHPDEIPIETLHSLTPSRAGIPRPSTRRQSPRCLLDRWGRTVATRNPA